MSATVKGLRDAALKRFEPLETKGQIEALPVGSIIFSEIDEYHGHFVMIKLACGGHCTGWAEFSTYVDARGNLAIDIGDDWTPVAPALLIAMGEVEEDEGGDQ